MTATAPATTVRIRSPLPMRIFVTAFLIVWMVGAVASGVNGHGAGIGISAAFVAFGLLLAHRVLRLGVDADQTSLVVRNNLRTRTFARSDVEGFRTGTPPQFPGGALTIFVLTHGGETLAVDAAASLTFVPAWRRRTERQLEELRAWLGA